MPPPRLRRPTCRGCQHHPHIRGRCAALIGGDETGLPSSALCPCEKGFDLYTAILSEVYTAILSEADARRRYTKAEEGWP